jgi:hypothetical protein
MALASGSAPRWLRLLHPKTVIQNLVQVVAARSYPRTCLNALYLRFTPGQRSQFHGHFAQLFRGRCRVEIHAGFWTVEFGGKRIVLPLRVEHFWLDWDTALSIIGHDIEIKETYGALLDRAGARMSSSTWARITARTPCCSLRTVWMS